VRGEAVHTTVKLGGELSNNKGINKQGGGLTAPALTAKDMEDIRTAMSFQADYVAVSFPKNATDMEMARQLCNVAAAEYGHKPGLIAKIERAEAIPELLEILLASDGIMVARGDLAVEVGNAASCRSAKTHDQAGPRARRVVITATQMMESMITNPVPTRAEVSDVANAVLDGTDAVMLSAETAAGKYPLETIIEMANICQRPKGHEDFELDADFTGKTFQPHRPVHCHGCTVYRPSPGRQSHRGHDRQWLHRAVDEPPPDSRADLRADLQSGTQRKMALYRNVRPLLWIPARTATPPWRRPKPPQGARHRAKGRCLCHHLWRTHGGARRHQHAQDLPRGLSHDQPQDGPCL
jgi:pyruvate kinase